VKTIPAIASLIDVWSLRRVAEVLLEPNVDFPGGRVSTSFFKPVDSFIESE
jgi:hypothetical protein